MDSVSIYDFAMTHAIARVETSEAAILARRIQFTLPSADILASPDREYIVALRRADGCFAVQHGEFCVVGRVNNDFTPEQLSRLQPTATRRG